MSSLWKCTINMAQGAFIVSPDPNNSRDILFHTSAAVTDIPEEQQRFVNEVHRTLTVLRGLFPEGDPKFVENYNSLLGLCRFAVDCNTPSAQPTHGLQALATYQADITAREGGRVKNNYMKKLGLNAVFLGVPAFLSAYLLSIYNLIDLATACFYVLWGGCMAGVWLSFGSRKTVLKFESLHILEEDRLEPIIRLIFAGLLTVTLGLLFTTEVVTFTIGKLVTTSIVKDIKVSLLIGLLCGISEQALSSTVTNQASKFLKLET